MTRIGGSGFSTDRVAERQLQAALAQLAQTSRQLATQRRITRGADDPAGLVALGQIEAELDSLEADSGSLDRAAGLVAVADSGLEAAGRILNNLADAVVAAGDGTLDPAARDALQQEIDQGLAALDRLGGTVAFAGQRLLDGSAGTLAFATGSGSAVSLELPTVSSTALGDATGTLAELRSGGSAALANDTEGRGQELVRAARNQVLSARARLGSFSRSALESAAAGTNQAELSLRAEASRLGDADSAQVASQWVRARILARSALAAFDVSNARRELLAELVAESRAGRAVRRRG